MRQGITVGKKIMQQDIKNILWSSLETMDFGKIFMRQGILLGHVLCDRVQGVERFATHPRHSPSQIPPPRDATGQEIMLRFPAMKRQTEISSYLKKGQDSKVDVQYCVKIAQFV